MIKKTLLFTPSHVNKSLFSRHNKFHAGARAGRFDIVQVMSFHGCSESCTTKIHNLLPGEVQFFNSHFNSRSHQCQNQWLLEFLNSNCSRFGSHHNYHICDKPVCKKLWLAALSLSPSRYYRIHAQFIEGKIMLDVSHSRKMSLKSNEAVAWMSNYFER